MMNKDIPQCIGVIMDGNRRYAKAHGLPTLEGHRQGYEKLREVLGWLKESNISTLVVYAFSTENWKRPKEEVSYLLDLFRFAVKEQLERAKKERTRLLFPGDHTQFPEDIQEMIRTAEQETGGSYDCTLAIALSYGGRAEIIDAIKRIPESERATLSEETFGKYIWTKDIPDPDMVIRTSGEQRTSGFLTWKSVYSELFFTETLWPAFSREEFDAMLKAYAERERRFGK